MSGKNIIHRYPAFTEYGTAEDFMVKYRRYVTCSGRSGGMADARDLKSREAYTSYRFESGLRQ